jgi:hypothetical protein
VGLLIWVGFTIIGIVAATFDDLRADVWVSAGFFAGLIIGFSVALGIALDGAEHDQQNRRDAAGTEAIASCPNGLGHWLDIEGRDAIVYWCDGAVVHQKEY